MYALVDCNSFYASCERLFRPDLKDKPIVVLSNNDGCAIAMCDKAKKLGIKIGTPHFQIKDTLAQHGVQVFSSNYTLYGDISRRVMSTLAELAPAIEVYSIDEGFLDLRGMEHFDLQKFAVAVRAKVLRDVGIPTCVGIGSTKALAKCANKVAKKFKDKTQGVWILDSPDKLAKCLKWLPVEDVWGIGYRHAERLRSSGVKTAWDFAALPQERVRKTMSVVGARLQLELNGVSCIPLELMRPTKQTICTSRSFGHMLDDLEAVESAVGHYAAACARKLRAQRLCAGSVSVFLHTNSFKPELPQRFVSDLQLFPCQTSDTLEIVGRALSMLRGLWKGGYLYKKAGVVVMDTVPDDQVQGDVFDGVDRNKARRAMVALDTVNAKHGDIMRLGVVRTGGDWRLRRELLSPRYTTDWDQILVVE